MTSPLSINLEKSGKENVVVDSLSRSFLMVLSHSQLQLLPASNPSSPFPSNSK